MKDPSLKPRIGLLAGLYIIDVREASIPIGSVPVAPRG